MDPDRLAFPHMTRCDMRAHWRPPVASCPDGEDANNPVYGERLKKWFMSMWDMMSITQQILNAFVQPYPWKVGLGRERCTQGDKISLQSVWLLRTPLSAC